MQAPQWNYIVCTKSKAFHSVRFGIVMIRALFLITVPVLFARRQSAVWCNDNALDLCSEVTLFESRLGHHLTSRRYFMFVLSTSGRTPRHMCVI
jgi:hypothetical protein